MAGSEVTLRAGGDVCGITVLSSSVTHQAESRMDDGTKESMDGLGVIHAILESWFGYCHLREIVLGLTPPVTPTTMRWLSVDAWFDTNRAIDWMTIEGTAIGEEWERDVPWLA